MGIHLNRKVNLRKYQSILYFHTTCSTLLFSSILPYSRQVEDKPLQGQVEDKPLQNPAWIWSGEGNELTYMNRIPVLLVMISRVEQLHFQESCSWMDAEDDVEDCTLHNSISKTLLQGSFQLGPTKWGVGKENEMLGRRKMPLSPWFWWCSDNSCCGLGSVDFQQQVGSWIPVQLQLCPVNVQQPIGTSVHTRLWFRSNSCILTFNTPFLLSALPAPQTPLQPTFFTKSVLFDKLNVIFIFRLVQI